MSASDESPRLLILGAHPDDAEYRAGGLAAAYRERGYTVKMISVTNGAAGHHTRPPDELIEIRREELARSAATIGAESDVWEHPDGMLMPSLELRLQVIREVRRFQPDLLLTHRPDDYHPDHRAVGYVVRDASYMFTVPHIAAEAPALRCDPVVGYLNDGFTRPYPFQADVVLDIGQFADQVVQMLACHESQVYEWLPYNRGDENNVPEGDEQRLAWLHEQFAARCRVAAEKYRPQLTATYGEQHAREVGFVEVFEISEYATALSAESRRRLFPGLP